MSRLIAALILVAASAVAAADGDPTLDELGQVPRIRVRFDGALDSCGEENVKWSGQKPKRLEWSGSRGGKALKLSSESGYPEVEGFRLGDEWTLVAVAKGAPKGEGIIWSIGTGILWGQAPRNRCKRPVCVLLTARASDLRFLILPIDILCGA